MFDFFKMNYHTCSKHNYTGTKECPNCVIEKNKIYLKNIYDQLIVDQKAIPKKYVDIVNEHFWDLI